MKTEDKYSKWAKVYDRMEEKMPMGKYKRKAVNLLNGKILEIGIGSGTNLKFYNKNMDLTGIDFSKGMLKLAREKCKKLHLENVKLMEMDIENMDFPNNTFDSILSTCVFCTVPHPEKGLKEVYRVLKPGGKVIFLEHMKSKYFIINCFLNIMNPITKYFLGTSLLRETEDLIRKIGFSKVESKNVMMKDVLRFIIAEK